MKAFLFFIISIFSSWFCTKFIMMNAKKLKLISIPNNRSSHIHPTPNGGGLGFVVPATVVGIILACQSQQYKLIVVLGLGLPITIIGFLDDVYSLSIWIRLFVQILICITLLYFLAPIPNEMFLYNILLLMGVWWINLFNFMDGIDGIAAAQAITTFMAANTIIVCTSSSIINDPVWLFMTSIIATILGFIQLNWAPAKIFMGDVGSTWLAFMIFAMALLTIQSGYMSYSAWIILCAVFVTDATGTLLTRILKRECLYKAHRTHAYQILAYKNNSNRTIRHRNVTLLIIFINLLWLLPLAYLSLIWPKWSISLAGIAYLPLIIGTLCLRSSKIKYAE